MQTQNPLDMANGGRNPAIKAVNSPDDLANPEQTHDPEFSIGEAFAMLFDEVAPKPKVMQPDMTPQLGTADRKNTGTANFSELRPEHSEQTMGHPRAEPTMPQSAMPDLRPTGMQPAMIPGKPPVLSMLSAVGEEKQLPANTASRAENDAHLSPETPGRRLLQAPQMQSEPADFAETDRVLTNPAPRQPTTPPEYDVKSAENPQEIVHTENRSNKVSRAGTTDPETISIPASENETPPRPAKNFGSEYTTTRNNTAHQPIPYTVGMPVQTRTPAVSRPGTSAAPAPTPGETAQEMAVAPPMFNSGSETNLRPTVSAPIKVNPGEMSKPTSAKFGPEPSQGVATGVTPTKGRSAPSIKTQPPLPVPAAVSPPNTGAMPLVSGLADAKGDIAPDHHRPDATVFEVAPSQVGSATSPSPQQVASHASQIIRQIAETALGMQDRPVELTLNPEELGRVRLTLQPVEGGMAVSVSVERPETLNLLRRHIESLAAELRELGYRDVSFSFAGQDSSFDESDQSALPQKEDDQPDLQTAATETRTTQNSPVRQISPDHIDIRL